MESSSEDVLLVMNNVRHKKNDGALYIMASRVAWMPDGKEVMDISHNYADIKIQKISPDNKAKVQLQLVLVEGASTTFRFVNPAGQDAQKTDRDEVKSWLMQLLPKFKKKITNELEEKQKVLQNDAKLLELYTNLVVGKVIPAEKFWQTYMPKKEEEQPIGVVGSFLVDVKPEASDGVAGFKYNLTTDTIDNIFKTYPAVEAKYIENVPERMSEKDFWGAFCQSHYFHRDRLTGGRGDVFAECSRHDDSEMRVAVSKDLANPLFDLRTHADMDFSNLSSNPLEIDASKLTPNQELIRRFNFHSLMVVKSSKFNQPKDAKKVKILEKTEYPDLEGGHAARVSITLGEPEKYQTGPVADVISDPPMEKALGILTDLSSMLRGWSRENRTPLSSSAALTALGDLSPNGSLMKHSLSMKSSSRTVIPEGIQRELFHVQFELNELLRHFWQCYPVTSGELERKIESSKISIENFRAKRFQTLIELAREKHDVNITIHLREMIDAALEKFATWRKKRSQKSVPGSARMESDPLM